MFAEKINHIFRLLYKVALKYVVVSIYLSSLIIKTALIHLEIRNIPSS